MFVVKDES